MSPIEDADTSTSCVLDAKGDGIHLGKLGPIDELPTSRAPDAAFELDVLMSHSAWTEAGQGDETRMTGLDSSGLLR